MRSGQTVIGGILLVVASLLALALAATALADTPSPSPSPSPTETSNPSPSPTATATPTPSPTPVASSLRVLSVSPQRNSHNTAPSRVIIVRFSAKLAADTHYPRLSPSIRGSWQILGSTKLKFVPEGHLPIYTTVRLRILAGSAGVHGVNGERLAAPYTTSFSVGGPSSVPRLAQLLAEVGYLPLRFIPAGTSAGAKGTGIATEPRNADLISLEPLKGSFAWRYRGIPRTLRVLWQPRQSNVILRGALMAFQSDHGMSADGVAGQDVWITLLKAVAQRKPTRRQYNYIEVATSLPQKLYVWRAGRIVYSTLANTGISAAPTARGTFPVYLRFLSTTMSGTNPDGSHYSDPGIPYVAYFNGGDAVHGFSRPGYGYPQSLGCVELPYSAAAVVYRYTQIGTLVCVF